MMQLKRHYKFFALIIFTVVFSSCTIGSSIPTFPGVTDPGTDPHYGTLSGNVTDAISGLELWSGRVEIDGKTTNISNGTFQIDDLPAGTYTVKISKQFYHPKQMEIVI